MYGLTAAAFVRGASLCFSPTEGCFVSGGATRASRILDDGACQQSRHPLCPSCGADLSGYLRGGGAVRQDAIVASARLRHVLCISARDLRSDHSDRVVRAFQFPAFACAVGTSEWLSVDCVASRFASPHLSRSLLTGRPVWRWITVRRLDLHCLACCVSARGHHLRAASGQRSRTHWRKRLFWLACLARDSGQRDGGSC